METYKTEIHKEVKMNSVKQHLSSKLVRNIYRLGFTAGIGVGAYLGIPPFVSMVEDLFGGTVAQVESMVSGSSLLSDGIKYLTMSFWLLGAYSIWKAQGLDKVKKFIALGFCGVVLVNLYSITSSDLAQYIVSSSVPIIATIIWMVVNIAEIFMLDLRNNSEALNKLLDKIGRNTKVNFSDDDTPNQIELKRILGKNKAAESLSFFMFCGAVAYVIEIGVNLKYPTIAINWAQALSPMGTLLLGWNLISAFIVLIITIGIIETFMRCLHNLDEMEDAIS